MNLQKLQKLHHLFVATLLLPLLFLTFSLNAQNGTLSVQGKVTDQNNAGLAGASVSVKNSSKGTITNNDGEFVLNGINGNDVLVISFKGFKTLDVPVNNQSNIAVSMQQDATQLEDVVVVGYGTQRKAATTGSIVSIKASELTQTPVANVAQGLQSRAAGVQINQNSGAPGGNISVRIRGTNSITGTSEPLYVVDGIQVSKGGCITSVSP